MDTNTETRAEKTERVKAKFAAEGKQPVKAKPSKKLKGKTNAVVVVKETAPKMTVEQADKKLAPITNEINVRFEKIEKLDGQADDHRLAAALRIEEARKICVASGIKFQEWAEKNLKQSYETVRKLAAIGKAPNPQLALEDMRNKNRKANQEHRQKKKTKELTQKVFGSAAEVLDQVKPEEALKAVKKFAANTGLVVVSETEHKELKQAAKSAELKKDEPLTLEGLKTAFAALSGRDKMTFVNHACALVGGKFVSVLGGDPVASKGDGDDLGIPEGMRRKRAPAA